MDGLVGAIEDWLGKSSEKDEAQQLYACLQNEQDRLMQAIFALCDERAR